MIPLKVKVEFAEVLVKLKQKEANASDISEIVRIVRARQNVIPDDVKMEILSIPSLILKEKCELVGSELEWVSNQASYFAGNCVHLEKWKNKFANKSFSFSDMSKFMDYILEDSDRLNSDFYLRNIEVTLRDNVCLKDESWYKDEQIIYAMVLENALLK